MEFWIDSVCTFCRCKQHTLLQLPTSTAVRHVTWSRNETLKINLNSRYNAGWQKKAQYYASHETERVTQSRQHADNVLLNFCFPSSFPALDFSPVKFRTRIQHELSTSTNWRLTSGTLQCPWRCMKAASWTTRRSQRSFVEGLHSMIWGTLAKICPTPLLPASEYCCTLQQSQTCAHAAV